MGTPERAAPDAYHSDEEREEREWEEREEQRKRDLAEKRAHYGERDHEPAA